ncbi:hypothetical protein KZ813_19115 [Sphingomonas sp. RHCKR7]|uniref:hypothetical protein n=1 Tax=Sphingomonas folli TaxID=2862497 RepID=UPI001CA50D7A|nr:hypothetical protein [Sphingomonas folli]MBW6528955.1 hypothetical protein [Sphingomonas folli]
MIEMMQGLSQRALRRASNQSRPAATRMRHVAPTRGRSLREGSAAFLVTVTILALAQQPAVLGPWLDAAARSALA